MQHVPRLLHAVCVLATVLVIGVLVYFAAASATMMASDPVPTAEKVVTALPWVLSAIAVWGIWRKLSYKLLIPVLAVGASVLIYLGWDANWLPPLEGIKLIPENSKSYAAYRWLVEADPHSRLTQQPRVQMPTRFPNSSAEWFVHYTENAQIYQAAWKNDVLGREWIEAMAANAPEGVYPITGLTGPKLSFSKIRMIAYERWGYAYVLFMDQHDDAAADVLLTYLRATYNFQRGSASLVSQMIAVIGVKGAYERLDAIVVAGRLSEGKRAEIAAVLKSAPPLKVCIDHGFLGSRAEGRIDFEAMAADPAVWAKLFSYTEVKKSPPPRWTWRLFFNPHRTEQEFDRHVEEAGQLVKSREPTFPAHPSASEWKLKNPAGQLALQQSIGTYSKISEYFWKTEIMRVGLLQHVETAE